MTELLLRALREVFSRIAICHCERSEATHNTKQSYMTGLLRRFAPRNDRIAASRLCVRFSGSTGTTESRLSA